MFEPFPTATDPSTDLRRRRQQAQGVAQQTATNATQASRTAQQFSQPQGGNFQATPPPQTAGDNGTALAQSIAGPRRARPQGESLFTSAPVTGPTMASPYSTSAPVTAPTTTAPAAGGATRRPAPGRDMDGNYTYPDTPPQVPTTPTPGGTPQPTVPTAPANMNTDGYAAPGYFTPGSAQAPAGWDPAKWANESHQTPKYAVGRILSQYPPTVEGLSKAVVDIQRAYPGSTFDGKDKVTIPGVGTIDVLQGASQGGSAWQWLDEANTGAVQAPQTGVPAGTAPTTNFPMENQPVVPPAAAPVAPVTPPTTPTAGPTTPQTPAPQAPLPTPTYQSYNIQTQAPTGPVIDPKSIRSYSGTQAPQYQTTDTSALTNLAAQLTGQPIQMPTGYSGPDLSALFAQIAQGSQGNQGPAPFNPAANPALGAAAGAAGTGPSQATPQYQAGQLSQFTGGAAADALARASSTLAQAAGQATPNVAGLKEAQKDTLLQLQKDQREGLLGNAASRGTLGSGATLGLEALLGDQFASNLTGAYRDIDINAQQQGFDNQMSLANALAGLGATQGSEGRADFSSLLAGQQGQEALNQAEVASGFDRTQLQSDLQGQNFDQLLATGNAVGSNDRANYTTGLAGQQQGSSQQNNNMDRLLALAGLQGDDARANYATQLAGTEAAAGLQNQQFGQATSLAELMQQMGLADFGAQMQGAEAQAGFDQAASADSRANAELLAFLQQQGFDQGMDRDRLGLDAANQANQFGLDAATLGQQGQLSREEMALRQLMQQNELGFNREQLGQQGALTREQMALQQLLANQQLGFDQQQLGQQGSQFDRDLALKQAVAGSNIDQNWWNNLFANLR